MSTTSSPSPSYAISQMKSLFRQFLRITTTDGRIFLGTFTGTDKHLNIILANAEEFRFAPREEANPNGRYVGLVMIPRRLMVKIEAPEGVLESTDGDNSEDGMYT
ncbi:hypothetical protein QCA50_000091 [Cerrena zonata]|uniref:Sm domain-containing protein n=1 Tax=Cerrena zonata TaxID=2478898 RepID=A0AAW0GZB4_9APHY